MIITIQTTCKQDFAEENKYHVVTIYFKQTQSICRVWEKSISQKLTEKRKKKKICFFKRKNQFLVEINRKLKLIRVHKKNFNFNFKDLLFQSILKHIKGIVKIRIE